jgi:anti-sigma factor RsiW
VPVTAPGPASPAGGHPTDETLNDYVDGRLPAQDHAALDAHVADCPDCRERVSALYTVIAMLGSDAGSDVPRSFRLGPRHRRH